MHEEIVRRLLAVNKEFYSQFARPFAESRAQPQPGFFKLLDYLPPNDCRLLDVGCGDGRLGRFFLDREAIGSYTGVDFSQELLSRARASTTGRFQLRDLSQPGCLEGLGRHDAVACLATMQHIPGRANRMRLMEQMGAVLAKGGRVFLANWQFPENARQRRKVADWALIGLSTDDVEPRDYLLTWQKGGFGLRYVCHIDLAETRALAQAAGLRVVDRFRSDGQESNLNLYAILALAE